MTDPFERPHDPLAHAYRAVRRIAPPDAPFAGMLARQGDAAVVLVDDTGTGAARAPDRGPHVLAPLDVARTADGHLLVYPWCVQALSEFLDRHPPGTLPEGEALTLAVSIHRGTQALRPARDGPWPRGRWWLTDAGCPVFVIAHADDQAADDASAAAWAELGGACAAGPVASQLAALTHDARDVEARLAGLARPEPLVLSRPESRRLTTFPRIGADGRATAGDPAAETETMVGEAGMAGRLVEAVRRVFARHVDVDLAETVSSAMHGARRRLRSAKAGRRRRPLLVAGFAAAGVLAVGLLWPASPPDATAGGQSMGSDVAGVGVADEPVAGVSDAGGDSGAGAAVDDERTGGPPQADHVDEGAAASSGDPVRALSALLVLAGTCASVCAEAFEVPEQAVSLTGVVAFAEAERRIELLDDLGGVAVLKVSAGHAVDVSPAVSPQVVVLADTGKGWRIRVIRDVPLP